MVDQHIGYPGSVGSADLAKWITNMIAQYSVDGPNDCKVVVTGGTRTAQVNPGMIIGDGVYDIFESPTPLTFASVGSGDRWDMVVLRRTWSATPGSSTYVFTIIQGSANKALPTRINNKGIQTDQPIALCRIRAGQNAVQEVVDLRVWAHNGGAWAVDDLVKDYLNEPGTHININGIRWYRSVTPSPTSNAAAWTSPDMPGDWVRGTYYSGWRTVTNGTPLQARLLPNGYVQVVGECLFEGPGGGGAVKEGWSPGILPEQFWPAQTQYVMGNAGMYDRPQVFYVYRGEVRYLGVYSTGPIAHFNGIYPLR